VHRRHGSKRVDVFTAHPNALSIVVANCIEEAVLGGKETWRHAGVEYKSHEGAEIGEGHRSTYDGESVVRWSDIIIPGDEAHSSWDVN